MNTLDQGILFEDSNQMIKWGKPIGLVAFQLKPRKVNGSDRTSFKWGRKRILNGLELQLQTMFWDTSFNVWFRKFNEIESWTIGDEASQLEFERISKHLIDHFGEPTHAKKESRPIDHYLAWKFKKSSISLHLFEQHVYKLFLSISINE